MSSKRKRSSKTAFYSGELNTPISKKPALSLALDAYNKPQVERDKIFQNENERISRRKRDKLPLLLKHFGIDDRDPDHWLLLAWRMAHEHVPGFQVIEGPKRERGRPSKWKGFQGKILIRDIEKINTERKRGVADAARIAVKRFPNRYKNYSGPQLVRRYYDCREEETLTNVD